MQKYQVDLSVTVRLTATIEATDIDAAWDAGDQIIADGLQVIQPGEMRIFVNDHRQDIIAPNGGIILNNGARLRDCYLNEVEMVRALPEGAA